MKKAIPKGTNVETCPVRVVQAWLAAAEITRDRCCGTRTATVGARRLDGGGIARLIEQAWLRRGRRSVEYLGHSLRAGFNTSAVQAVRRGGRNW